jgi:uncharacterized spore protein YtfJ
MDDQMRGPVERVNSQVDEMVRRMNASAVFGEPVQQGDVTLIPVAAVTYGFGTGQGWGRSKPEESPAEARMDEGGGGGGGGAGIARPLGYIRIDQNGATWEPTMDMTRVSIGGMLLSAWVIFWVMKMIRTVAGPRRSCC